MKVLIVSRDYLPIVGGLSHAVRQLAEGLIAKGHDVVLVTRTQADAPDPGPIRVERLPKLKRLIGLIRWCDVALHANLSLREIWPLLVWPRPLVVVHHGYYRGADGRRRLRDCIKLLLLRRAESVSVSRAVAADLGIASVVIPNAYDDVIFREQPGSLREKELIFVGRLVSDKGADLLLIALAELRRRGRRPHLTIVGGGPESEALQAQVAELQLGDQVSFEGVLAAPALAATLNRHQVLVVPSRWNEPFGIVALEAIACGCVVVGSAGGGLPEAIGPCGRTFPNGNADALTLQVEQLLDNAQLQAALRESASAHLAKHRGNRLIALYEEVLAAAIGTKRSGTACV